MNKKGMSLTPKSLLFGATLGTVLMLSAGCATTAPQKNTGPSFSDSAITSKIKTRLLEDQSLQGFQIKVDTYSGHVTLSGFVNEANEIQEALQLVHNVPGVVSVRNDLVVKKTLR
ncbi:MAG TPA: BON domain-containing protein [Acidiferrobacter sp.]|nr:BON domain-containing protein [Acidiferrobacter sp.]